MNALRVDQIPSPVEVPGVTGGRGTAPDAGSLMPRNGRRALVAADRCLRTCLRPPRTEALSRQPMPSMRTGKTYRKCSRLRVS